MNARQSTAQLAEVVDLNAHRLRKVENWVTKQQIARHFAVSTKTVERWMKRGCPVDYWPELTGRPRFRISAVADWLERG